MSETLAALTPLLTTLSNAGQAALAATAIFQMIRYYWPDPMQRPQHPLALAVYTCIYAPKFARISAIALAVLISLAAQALMAALQGRPVLAAFDHALAETLAAPLIGQILHGLLKLSTDTPADKAAQIHKQARTQALDRQIGEAQHSARAQLAIADVINAKPRAELELSNRKIRNLITFREGRPIFQPGVFEASRAGFADQQLQDWSMMRDGLQSAHNRSTLAAEERIAHLPEPEQSEARQRLTIASQAESYGIDIRYNHAILEYVRDEGTPAARASISPPRGQPGHRPAASPVQP